MSTSLSAEQVPRDPSSRDTWTPLWKGPLGTGVRVWWEPRKLGTGGQHVLTGSLHAAARGAVRGSCAESAARGSWPGARIPR